MDIHSPQERTHEAFPAFSKEMPVDVMGNYSTIILSGRLDIAEEGTLVIERIPEERLFSVQTAGSRVMVRGYDERMEPFTIRGIVTKSSMTRCVISHLELIHHDNMRKSIRYPLSPPTTVYALEEPATDETYECRLMNISTGGACISTTHTFSVGQILNLQVELIEHSGYIAYRCKVVRTANLPDGTFEYGLYFDQLDKIQTNALLRDIEIIQAAAKRRVSG